MLNLGWKKQLHQVIERPHISEECWQLYKDGNIDQYDTFIQKRTGGVWRNILNKKANKLNKFDYWEAD